MASSRTSASRASSAGRLMDVSWRGSRISVVFPTYNERDSIRAAIVDFASTDVVDEIVVVNNNAAAGTSEEVAAAAAVLPNETNVREVHEARQGYGFAIQRGLREATGDYIVVSEPDGTFLGRDTFKLLAYVDDFDVVYGSRTARTFIWRGANMGAWLRWGNWGVAKLMEFLFNSTNLTDVGCTMRLVRRDALAEIEDDFTVGGSALRPRRRTVTPAPRLSARRSPRVLEKSISRSGMQLLWKKHSPLTPRRWRIVSSNWHASSNSSGLRL